ncbi:MAG: glycoside hydrolase family 108 protein [Stellaceae bacterium]
MDAFDAAFAVVAALEGGFANEPDDPGGATRFGISKRAYPGLDIARLTLEDAKAIYRRDYWEAHRCGAMPWRWALAAFDGAVNQGAAAILLLQRALGLAEDGVVGPETLRLAAEANDDAFAEFLALRAERYAATAGFARFGRGWLKRLFRVTQAAAHAPH